MQQQPCEDAERGCERQMHWVNMLRSTSDITHPVLLNPTYTQRTLHYA